MDQNKDTEDLRSDQLARELEERRLAEAAPQDEETATHERRAEKARYLREKLEERAESERGAPAAGGAAEDDAPERASE